MTDNIETEIATLLSIQYDLDNKADIIEEVDIAVSKEDVTLTFPDGTVICRMVPRGADADAVNDAISECLRGRVGMLQQRHGTTPGCFPFRIGRPGVGH